MSIEAPSDARPAALEKLFSWYQLVVSANILAPVSVYTYERLSGKLRDEDLWFEGMGHGPWYNSGGWQMSLVNGSLLLFLGFFLVGIFLTLFLHTFDEKRKPWYLWRGIFFLACQLVAWYLSISLIGPAID